MSGRERIKQRTRTKFQQLMGNQNINTEPGTFSATKNVEEIPLLAKIKNESKMYPSSEINQQENDNGQSNQGYTTESTSSLKESPEKQPKYKNDELNLSKKKKKKTSSVKENINQPSSKRSKDIKKKGKLKEKTQPNDLSQENENPVLGVLIHGTDKLKTDFLICHPLVKVHIVNMKTGQYLKKLHSDRSVTSYYETQNNNIEHIIPMMTQPYDLKEKKYLMPLWEELLIFNEDFNYFINKESDVIIFFELIDFISPESNFSNKWLKKLQNQGGWHKIAWGFLKLVGANDILNTEQKVRLQLYNPPKFQFWKKIEGLEVFNWWSKFKKSYYPSTLYVTVKPVILPKSVDSTVRSMAPFQEEKSLSAHIQIQNVTSSNSHSDSPKKPLLQPELWTRIAGQTCKIPNQIFIASQVSAFGCNAIRFSHSGRELVYGCSLENGHYIILHEIPSGTLRNQIKAHSGIIYDLDWSNDDSLLVSASGDSTVRIWSINDFTFSLISVLPHPCFVYCAKFHPKYPSVVVSGGYDKIIRVWTIELNGESKLHMELEGHNGNINALCWNTKGNKLFSADSVGIIRLWNAYLTHDNTEIMNQWMLDKEIKLIETQDIPINSLHLHNSGKKILFNCRNSTIFLYDFTVDLIIQHYYGYINFQHHLKCCLSACGNLIFAGGEDGKVIVWNTNTAEKLAVYDNLPYLGPVTSVDYHPHDHIVAMCSLEDNAPILAYKYDYNEPPVGADKGDISRSQAVTPQNISPVKIESRKGSDSSRNDSPLINVTKRKLSNKLKKKEFKENSTRLQKVVKKLDSVLAVESLMKTKSALPYLDNSEENSALYLPSKLETYKDKFPKQVKYDFNLFSYLVVALYDYNSNFPNELPLQKGDVINVKNREDSRWWFGRLEKSDVDGYFPSNYVTSGRI
ncbi:jouberin-like [Centruroides sculpturatus]|uniref:jouberin-like n=1 Tax=Centruroides sculpturatus TaxID=218467 RepID=UPI000C6E27FF|nr:jouberin-like [Centruroides sculpturatus]